MTSNGFLHRSAPFSVSNEPMTQDSESFEPVSYYSVAPESPILLNGSLTSRYQSNFRLLPSPRNTPSSSLAGAITPPSTSTPSNTTSAQDVLRLNHSPPSTSTISSTSSSISNPNHHGLTHLPSSEDSSSLQRLANHYGIPSVLPRPPGLTKSKPTLSPRQQEKQKEPEPTATLSNYHSVLSNYLTMLNTPPTTSTAVKEPPTDTTKTMQKEEIDPAAMQSIVDALLASPELQRAAETDINAYLSSPADAPFQSFETSPSMDTSPLFDFLDASPFTDTSPMMEDLSTPLLTSSPTFEDSPFADPLNTPLLPSHDDFGWQEPLIVDGAVGMYESVDPVLKEKSPSTPMTVSLNQLLQMSPESPLLISPSPPMSCVSPSMPAPSTTFSSSSSSSSSYTSTRKKATGTRANLTPDSLLPIDAPIQPRTYLGPSKTSRKEVPVTFARKRKHEEDDEELEAPPPNASEKEHIEYKRKLNTVAARKSRRRKLEHLQVLEDRNAQLTKEAENWRTRASLLTSMLKAAGITGLEGLADA